MRILATFAAFVLAATASAQVSTRPPGSSGGASFSGGTVTSGILGPTGCTTPAYSFTVDTDAGLCATAANAVNVQTGSGTISVSKLEFGSNFAYLNFYDAGGMDSGVRAFDNTLQLWSSGSVRQTVAGLVNTNLNTTQGPTGCTSPSYSFTSDTDAGLCLASANDATFQIASSGSRGFVHITGTVAQLEANLAGVVGRIEAQSATLSFMANGTSVGSWTDTAFTLLVGDFFVGHLTNDDQIRIVPVAAGAGAFQGSITSADLTAARTWTLPDASGGYLLDTRVNLDRTITGAGTTGAQTINKTAGTVNFAAAATTLVVTNSIVTASSIIFCTVRTNDSTATIKNVVPTSGSFTITLTAAATAETSVGFLVTN